MHTFDSTSTGVIHAFEGGIPFEGDGGAAGYTGLAGNATGCGVAGEVLSEDGAIVVLLFVLRRVDGEALGSMSHLFIGNRCRRYGFESINRLPRRSAARMLNAQCRMHNEGIEHCELSIVH